VGDSASSATSVEFSALDQTRRFTGIIEVRSNEELPKAPPRVMFGRAGPEPRSMEADLATV
jgi:hypothetical protein